MKQPPKGSGLYLITLQSGEQKYQSKLWSPPLNRIGKKKTWKTKNYNEAAQQHYAFKQIYEANNYDIIETLKPAESTRPNLIVQCAAFYERYLKDDPAIVAKHQAQNRDEKYIKNTVVYIKTFLIALKKAGIKVSHLKIKAVDDAVVGVFYNHLESRYNNGEIGEVTWNRHVTACRNWFNCLIKKFEYDIKNPFSSISYKSVFTDPQFLEMSEMDLFLKTITVENAMGKKGNQQVNYYRPWLKELYLLDMFIGARPKEFFALTWLDVTDNYIVVCNSKKTNNNNLKSDIEYVYIHHQLASLLLKLRAKSEKETDYIIQPRWKDRKTLQSLASKAFIHFFRQTGIDKKITFYNLRHTYINNLYAQIGESALNEKHKKETAIKHYLSKKRKQEAQQGKELFNIDVSAHI